MRAVLSHQSAHKKKGRLPEEIPEPRWLADPTHRIKVVAKAIFVLANLPAKRSECTNVDALKFKNFFGYMLKEGRSLTIEEMREKCLCVIEHLFNEHKYCDPRWCVPSRTNLPSKNAQTHASTPLAQTVNEAENLPPTHQSTTPTDNNQRAGTAPTKSFYRCKKRNRALYEQMVEAYEPYIRTERLLESMHPFHTQINVALNSIISKYAPKDRTYSSNMSLANRIAIVIGIHNDGHYSFWNQVFDSLGLPMSDDLAKNLRRKDETKRVRKEYNERKEVKLRRVRNHIEKVKELMKNKSWM